MDLFYIVGGHAFNVGVEDYYAKTRYAFGIKLFVQADFHAVYSHGKIFTGSGQNPQTELDPFCGTDIDLSPGYIFIEAILLQSGYSRFFHTAAFARAQPNDSLKEPQNRAYLMLVFRPMMEDKLIGILL